MGRITLLPTSITLLTPSVQPHAWGLFCDGPCSLAACRFPVLRNHGCKARIRCCKARNRGCMASNGLPRRRCTSATAPLHVCHAAVARLPRRRGKPFGRISSQKSALQRWLLAFPYRLDVYFLLPQASCERINAHYAARRAVWNGDICCQPRLGGEFSYITRVYFACM